MDGKSILEKMLETYYYDIRMELDNLKPTVKDLLTERKVNTEGSTWNIDTVEMIQLTLGCVVINHFLTVGLLR